MDLTECNKALSKAKINLMTRNDSVFFTTLCFSLRHVFDESIPTACCDGVTIKYNPKFFIELDPEERVFVLLHETLHAAYLHMLRFDSLPVKEHTRWNIAADHVINLQLQERKYKMPDWVFKDPIYTGMSTEEVYKALENTQLPEDFDQDLVMPGKGDPAAAQEAAAAMQDAIVRAALQSKMAGDAPGTIPGELQIFLDKLTNPQLPWNRILQKYMQRMAKTEYSYRKPNRRFFPDHHLPSMYGTALMDIAIAVDTSGSVSDADFNTFVSETHNIIKMMKPETVTFVQFDTQIKSVDKIHSVNELMGLKFSGRGGTNVKPVIEWANEKKPQVLLVFTDGEFHMPTEKTKVPFVWLIHNNNQFGAPFGKVIHYKL